MEPNALRALGARVRTALRAAGIGLTVGRLDRTQPPSYSIETEHADDQRALFNRVVAVLAGELGQPSSKADGRASWPAGTAYVHEGEFGNTVRVELGPR